jgi:putative colanic acid biosynthesis UDP-glucose lipid carrier transferase
MGYYTFIGIVYEGSIIGEQFITIGLIFGLSFFFRIISLYLVRVLRVEGKGYKRTVILGASPTISKLTDSLERTSDFGYQILGVFSSKIKNDNIDGTLDGYQRFCLENEIEQIYCSLHELSRPQLIKVLDFADRNLINVFMVPDEKGPFTRSMTTKYIAEFPVLQFRQIPLQSFEVRFVKRLFDLLFSSLVILLILSWLIPILGFLIKRESKGPVFFKQQRDGVDGQPFWCYKFRSMGVNSNADSQMAQKNDPRVTKIGAFIRKTSIDELPQFLNVFMGSMSVVGPRPHMKKHTKEFSATVDKYMVRHFVKPGITGLAQVSGYRGEIETNVDILNRVRYDIFYVENWSFLLDIKIIWKTFTNAIGGEEKAY